LLLEDFLIQYYYDSKISDKGQVLAADLNELISRDTSRLMRSLTQEMNISRTTVKKMLSKDGPDS
jgi:tape measure domain-containing protein